MSDDLWTSCDETDEKTEPQYSDDKLEMTCYEHWYAIILFYQSRFGQVRSPFWVALKSEDEGEDAYDPVNIERNAMGMSVDGEIFLVKGGKNVSIQLDPILPKIRVAKRRPVLKSIN